jgi:hypothetical protein
MVKVMALIENMVTLIKNLNEKKTPHLDNHKKKPHHFG